MKRILILVAAASMAALAFADPKGDEIARRHFALSKPRDTSATATMTIVDKAGNRKARKLRMFSRDGAEGKDSFVEFLEPADVAGTKLLSLGHKSGGSEQRLYLPALKKARKIASSGKEGSFVNSDLSFYDMEDRGFEDFSYSLLSDGEGAPDGISTEQKFYRLEMRPKDASSPYGRSVAWVGMDDLEIHALECFDRKDGSEVKSILFEKFEDIKGILIATSTLVRSPRKGSGTRLVLDGVKIDSGIKGEVFSVSNLER